jgi:hypothetical protein
MAEEYQTEELRSAASLVLEHAQLTVDYEEWVAKRNAEKAAGGLTKETQDGMQEAADKLRAIHVYWRGVREWFAAEAMAAEAAAAAEVATTTEVNS